MTGEARNTPRVRMSDASAELCDLLSAQIACTRDGNLVQVEQLCARADGMVARMKETGANQSITESQQMHLEQLYEELILMLRVEHADVEARLKQLRQVKRAVGAYGGKARP